MVSRFFLKHYEEIKKMKIIHIKQRHNLPFNIKPTDDYIESAAHSQFLVAQSIKKMKNYPILDEGLCEDILESANLEPMSSIARAVFFDGMPDDFDELTSLQKEFLYDYGGAHTLLFLGDIHTLYKSIHRETAKEIDKRIENGNFLDMLVPREEEAMSCAKEIAINKFDNLDHATIIIVYGAAHDFSPYCKKEGFIYETIDTLTSEKDYLFKSHMKTALTKQTSMNTPFNMFMKKNDDDFVGSVKKIGDISLTIKKCSFDLELYKLVVSKNGKNKTAMYVDKEYAHTIMNLDTHSLIEKLENGGSSENDIAMILKSAVDYQPNINFRSSCNLL